MEIESLKLVVTDADANRLLAEFAPKDLEVENVRVSFTSAGILVTGDTSALLFKVSFETLWDVSALEGHFVAQLRALKVAGIPAGRLRGVILKVLRDTVQGQPGVTVLEEMIRVEINEVLKTRDIPLRVQLRTVRCADGAIVLEA